MDEFQSDKDGGKGWIEFGNTKMDGQKKQNAIGVVGHRVTSPKNDDPSILTMIRNDNQLGFNITVDIS